MKKKIRILITGSKGFVGSSLTKYLKRKKKLIILNDDKEKFDLSKSKKFKQLLILTNPHYVIHLAARTVSGISTNYENKMQIRNTYKPVVNLITNIKNCKNLKKIIFVGSIEEYGISKRPFKESFKEKPTSSYGRYKLKSFKYVKKRLKNKEIDYIWLRPSLMFGPNDNNLRFLGTIFNSVKNEEKFKVNLGNQIRDYLYIEDFNRFVFHYLLKKDLFKLNLLNITNENWVTLRSILNKISLFTQNKIKNYLVICKKFDNSKLINSGFLFKKNYPNFNFTNFNLALKKTIKSYGIK